MSNFTVVRRILVVSAIAVLVGLVSADASATPPTAATHVAEVDQSARAVVGDFADHSRPLADVRHTITQMSVTGSALTAKLHEIHAVADYRCAHAVSGNVSDQLWSVLLTNLQRFANTVNPTWNSSIQFLIPKVEAFHATETLDACVGANLQAILNDGKQYFAPYVIIALLPLVDPNVLSLTWSLLDSIEAGIWAIH